MTAVRVAADTSDETSTVADIHEDLGKNPDRTGDYAAGRVYSFGTGAEFLDWIDSLQPEPADD